VKMQDRPRDTSCRLAIESLKYFFRKRFEEGAWSCEASFGQADRTRTGRSRWQRRDFCNGLIALAEENTIAGLELRQILRKMCFGIMNIELYHGSIIA
jgi:hypothetical protein